MLFDFASLAIIVNNLNYLVVLLFLLSKDDLL